MFWVEIIIAFFLGGFIGITLMAVLFVSGREEKDMEKYFTSFTNNNMEIDAEIYHVREFKI